MADGLIKLCRTPLTHFIKGNNIWGATSLLSPSNVELMQKRDMSRVKQRHTHPYFWWTKKRRERHDQEITSDNQDFVNKVVLDRYGPAYVPDSPALPYVSPLRSIVNARHEWTPQSRRVGAIGRKIGVYPVWDKDGKKHLYTLIQIVDNHVIKYFSPEETERNYGDKFKGLALALVGAESADPQRFTKEYMGLFRDCGTLPKVKLDRFIVSEDAALLPGTPIYANHFYPGQFVDITGKTIDHGFEGVMVRHGFKGGPSDKYGCTKSHRRPGCIGSGRDKARVWPGQKMPGHMGQMRRTTKGVEIVRINTKYNVLFIKGPAIPGECGNFVSIRDCCVYRLRHSEAPPFPTFFPEELDQPLPEDLWHPDFHSYDEPTIMYDDKK